MLSEVALKSSRYAPIPSPQARIYPPMLVHIPYSDREARILLSNGMYRLLVDDMHTLDFTCNSLVAPV